MARSDDAAQAAGLPSDEQVASYLKAHPDFLLRHPEVAVRIAAPAREDGSGNIADLQQFMIERLRQELDQMRGCAEHLITTTRSNMSTQSRTHKAVLAALAAKDMAELVLVLGDAAEPFEVDAVALCFETAAEIIPTLSAAGLQRLPGGGVDILMGDDSRDIALKPQAPGDAVVFGSAAGLVRSQALVRLGAHGRCPPGLLALGSRHDRTFHPGQGTELLSFFAQVIAYSVRRWVG